MPKHEGNDHHAFMMKQILLTKHGVLTGLKIRTRIPVTSLGTGARRPNWLAQTPERAWFDFRVWPEFYFPLIPGLRGQQVNREQLHNSMGESADGK